MMEGWLFSESGDDDPCNAAYQSRHGIITVTNYGEHAALFSCKNCPTVCYCWVFCLPCCMVSYPIYKVNEI